MSRPRIRPLCIAFLFLLLLSLSAGPVAGDASAATFAVDDTADSPDAVPGDGSCNNGVGECTLRAAVEESNALVGADAVMLLADSTYGLFVNDGGAIEITEDLSITGGSGRTTVIAQETDGNGDGLDRVFDVQGTATRVTLTRVHVTDGRATAGNGFFGGNIRSDGILTVDHSTVSAGRAFSGGGISNVGGTLTVQHSTISGNSAPDGGADSGAIQNFVPSDGRRPSLIVDNSTISGNTAGNVGGILNWGGASDSGGTITIRNSTIADNVSTAVNAGGLHLSNNSTATFENSIVADNTSASGQPGPNCSADPGSSIISNGHNLESVDECGFQSAGDLQAMDPFLGALENNGGETDTQPPSVDSPVLDAGTCPPAATTGAASPVQAGSATLTGSVTPPADQRDVIRPQESACDMGAFEIVGNFVQPTSFRFDYGTTPAYGSETPLTGLGALVNAQHVTADVGGLNPGTTYHFRLIATNGTDTGFGSNGTFTTPILPSPVPVPVPVPDPVTLDELPDPVLARNVNVDQVSGTVLVGIRGTAAAQGAGARTSQKGITFVPLTEARQIPAGSFLDTRRGTVRLQSARDRRGTRQQGDFGSGLFQVLQSRRRSARGLTDLVLKGSSFRSCRRAGRGKRASAAQSIRRRLRANARGRFRTRGRHSAATVRGTVWLTADRCDGTLTRVTRGRVAVRDFRRKRTIVVRAGKSYLAKAPR